MPDTSTVSKIPTENLFLDFAYQRQPKPNKIKAMLKAGFDSDQAGALIVSARGNGRFAIIDGGHRWELAKMSGVPILRCIVHRGMTPQREAKLFTDIQTNRTAMSKIDFLRGMVMAGDKDALEILHACQAAGFKIASWRARDTINAGAALVTAYEAYGLPALKGGLQILRDAWDGEISSCNGYLLEGAARWVVLYNADAVMCGRLVSKLVKMTPDEVFRKARATATAMGFRGKDSLGLPITFATIYNTNLRKDNASYLDPMIAANASARGIKGAQSRLNGNAAGGSSPTAREVVAPNKGS